MMRSSGLTTGVLVLFACRGAPSPSPYQADAARASQAGPVEVVHLLALWDTAGKNVSSGGAAYDSARASLICWLPSERCQTDEPGWDSHSVVTAYAIRLVSQDGDSALVEVVYDKVADWQGRYKSVHEPVRWNVHLQRLDGRWRVVSPESQKPPFISREAALRLVARSQADTMALRREVRR